MGKHIPFEIKMTASAQKLDEVIEYFAKHGAGAVRDFEYIVEDPSQSSHWYSTKSGKSGISCVGMTPSMFPVYAAALLGFPTRLIAETIRRAEIDPVRLSQYFEFGKNDYHRWAEGTEINAVELVKKIIEAISYNIPDQDDLHEKLRAAMLGHSIIGIGVMSLGIEGLDPASKIEHDAYRILATPDDIPQYIEGSEAFYLTDVLYHITNRASFPNNSILQFIEQSGALNPVILKKTFTTGFWEAALFRGTMGHEIFREVFSELIDSHPETALYIFKSMDFRHTDFSVDVNNVDYFFESACAAFARKGLGINDDISFKLGRMTAYLTDHQSGETPPLGSPAELISETLMGEAVSDFELLTENKATIFKELILSHLQIPAENISLSNFRIWDFVRDLEPGPQLHVKELLTHYLAHMAKGALNLHIEGSHKITDYKQCVNDPLDNAMSMLVQNYRNEIQYDHMKKLDEDSKAQLSRWGLSVRELGVKRSSTLESRMSSDLGL